MYKDSKATINEILGSQTDGYCKITLTLSNCEETKRI